MHILRGRYPYSYGDDDYSIDELRKKAQRSCEDRRKQDDFKIINRAVDDSHHKFISVHCEKLLRDLFCMKSGERLFGSMDICLDFFLAGSLNAGQKYCRMLQGNLSAILLPTLSYQLSKSYLFCF